MRVKWKPTLIQKVSLAFEANGRRAFTSYRMGLVFQRLLRNNFCYWLTDPISIFSTFERRSDCGKCEQRKSSNKCFFVSFGCVRQCQRSIIIACRIIYHNMQAQDSKVRFVKSLCHLTRKGRVALPVSKSESHLSGR